MTPLQEYHHRHAQHFVDLHGHAIPLHYTTPQAELQAARRAAVLDTSFCGKLRVTGKDREVLLHRLTTNEMRNLQPGETRVNVFTNAKGRVVDRVEMLAEEQSYLLLASPGRAETLLKWIEKYTFLEDVKSFDLTPDLGIFSLFGKESDAQLERAWGVRLREISAGHFSKVSWQDKEIMLHRPEAANPARFNLILPSTEAPALWQLLVSHFAPMGFAAYETLRILQGIPAAGHEIVEEHNPHEIGLHPFIDFDKGCYIGQEVIARLDSYQKVQRQLTGVKCAAEARLLENCPLWHQEQEIGKITSVASSPEGRGAIALAVIRKAWAQPHALVTIRGEHESFPAELVELPFAE